MGERDSRVTPPLLISPAVSSPAGKKRDLCYHPSPASPSVPVGVPLLSWNPSLWDWDCAGFVGKPTEEKEILRRWTDPGVYSSGGDSNSACKAADEEDGRLDLNLDGGLNSAANERPPAPPVPSSRSSKRVRLGSPGACQVDNCEEDLSMGKDYHRRHKVCEHHSKASKALVRMQMQRFCQQCSRFHLLAEFDEGKRSCRRRLAGHNRRRRKTHQEDPKPQLVVQVSHENASNKGLNIVSLLTAISHTQGNEKSVDKSFGSSPVPNGDHLRWFLDLASKLHNSGSLSSEVSEKPSPDQINETKENYPSTKDFLTGLSSSQFRSSLNTPPSMLSQQSSEREEPNSNSLNQGAGGNFPKADMDARSRFEFQLFTSSPDNENSPPKLESSKKYFSSGGSNAVDEQSPFSSPVMQNLFPMHSATEDGTPKNNEKVEDSRNSNLRLQLFSGLGRVDRNNFFQGLQNESGCPSSSGSDNSPSSSSSDADARTGRIIFKLFDKDPSHLPMSLRTQILNWLSNSPLEIESYIRPGCVVLSIYLLMPSPAWNKIQRNLVQLVNSLVQDSSVSDFWRTSRFLVNTSRKSAMYKDGKIRLHKSWMSRNYPELISVFPLAIVPDQEATLLLLGRNLANNNTRFYCAYNGSYMSLEVSSLSRRGTSYEEIRLYSFSIKKAHAGVTGRCFIEVENGLKGACFPIIIADAAICRELAHLECEFRVSGDILEADPHVSSRHRAKENVLHFLNELGWLFQKNSSFSLSRFRFLLMFSVERDYTALVKTLLDMLIERNSDSEGPSREAMETLTGFQLLHRAVKHKCTKMTEMLIHYSVDYAPQISHRYIFPPNTTIPEGLTPLHLAASTSGSYDIIDILTNDPQQIGVSIWNSLLDASGKSPHSYAVMSNNDSYNILVNRKLIDRDNNQISMTVMAEAHQPTTGRARFQKSCETCIRLSSKCRSKGTMAISRGLFFHSRPYINPIIAIGAVCVCVCLFMRALPGFGKHGHFAWECLAHGTM